MKSIPHKLLIFGALAIFLIACDKTSKAPPEGASNATKEASHPTVEELLKRYRETESYRSSLVKSRARITESDGSAQEVLMTVYRKRAADGSEQILIEITQPAEQKDRSGLIRILPDGEIEGLRYAQGTNSFVSTRNISGEDSLFGMSLQEMADGQPEKYDFKLVGEEIAGSTAVYKLDGKLKEGADSKFRRLVVYLAKDNSALAGAEFYFNETELARKVIIEKIEPVGGRWARKRWVADNLARAKKVEFETLSVKYDQNIADSIFTRENLKRISSR